MDWLLLLMAAFYVVAVVMAIVKARPLSRWVLAVLGASLGASMLPMEFALWEEQVVWLMMLDGLVCFACFLLWVNKIDMQAWSVLAIGTVKNVLAFFVLCFPAALSWGPLSLLVDALFAAQVICAGGYLNAIGAWLDHRLSRIAPKRHKLLRGGV